MMTPAEYREAARIAEGDGNVGRARALRATATRIERQHGDAGAPVLPSRRPAEIRVPRYLQEIADDLIVPVDEGGPIGTSVAEGRLVWNHDGGRDKRPVDDPRLADLSTAELIRVSLALNARIGT